MAEITDDFMHEMLGRSRGYTVMILKAAPGFGRPDTDALVWEHGRRNFSLRADKRLAIICPVTDDSGVCGIGVFDADADEVSRLMDEDPGVRAGIFTYEVHPCRSFPGDALPG